MLAILLYILPYFLGETQVSEKIQEQLQGAEIKLGTYLGESFRQVAPTTLVAAPLDTGNRSIVFACNDSKLCCLKGEVCSKNIEWDERILKLIHLLPQFSVIPTLQCLRIKP